MEKAIFNDKLEIAFFLTYDHLKISSKIYKIAIHLCIFVSY